MEKMYRNFLILFLILTLLTTTGAAIAFGWTITDLGMGDAYGINNAGQVAGYVNTGLQDSNGVNIKHAAIWSNGTVIDIGTLGGANSYALDINNIGQVVGYSGVVRVDGTPYMDPEPFLWDNGAMTQLAQSGAGALAYSVNDSGQAVGFSIAGNEVWGHAVSLNLPSDQQFNFLSSAFDINNAGQAVGYGYSRDTSGLVGLLWDKGAVTTLDSLSSVYAINDHGQVVGGTSDGNAALWDNGTVIDIGPAQIGGGKVFDINNSGQVVGTGLINNNSPYLWESGTTIDLNSLVYDTDWILESANAINDFGQIVGTGTFKGQRHAFLLTPDVFNPAPVPEPSTVFLLGVGIVGMGGARILKRKTYFFS